MYLFPQCFSVSTPVCDLSPKHISAQTQALIFYFSTFFELIFDPQTFPAGKIQFFNRIRFCRNLPTNQLKVQSLEPISKKKKSTYVWATDRKKPTCSKQTQWFLCHRRDSTIQLVGACLSTAHLGKLILTRLIWPCPLMGKHREA